MKGKVEVVEKSKSGKAWRVKIAGKWINANFDTKIESANGRDIDYMSKTGEYGEWLESWIFDAPTMAPVTRTSNGDRWYMPFVSNTVAHAISAGVCKNPSELNQWAKAAYEAAQALDAL